MSEQVEVKITGRDIHAVSRVAALLALLQAGGVTVELNPIERPSRPANGERIVARAVVTVPSDRKTDP